MVDYAKILNQGYIREEKVEAAIKKLNYEPNVYARGFKINKTNTIALILPTIWNPFFSELAYNIEKNIKKLGMKIYEGKKAIWKIIISIPRITMDDF